MGEERKEGTEVAFLIATLSLPRVIGSSFLLKRVFIFLSFLLFPFCFCGSGVQLSDTHFPFPLATLLPSQSYHTHTQLNTLSSPPWFTTNQITHTHTPTTHNYNRIQHKALFCFCICTYILHLTTETSTFSSFLSFSSFVSSSALLNPPTFLHSHAYSLTPNTSSTSIHTLLLSLLFKSTPHSPLPEAEPFVHHSLLFSTALTSEDLPSQSPITHLSTSYSSTSLSPFPFSPPLAFISSIDRPHHPVPWPQLVFF